LDIGIAQPIHRHRHDLTFATSRYGLPQRPCPVQLSC
jgi:hypothetical protein